MTRILVFGGHSPIALELCKLLAGENIEVVLATRTPDETLRTELAPCTNVSLASIDLRRPVNTVEAVLSMAKKTPFSGLVFSHRSHGADTWQERVQIEVVTPQLIVDALCEAGHPPSSCVFLGSPAQNSVLADQDFVYHLAKSGVAALVRYLANSYGPLGVRVNTVSPDAYVTKPRSAHYWRNNELFRTSIERQIPMQRFAETDDIAHVIKWLLGPQSAYVTGQTVRVDGGISTVDRASIIRELARSIAGQD